VAASGSFLLGDGVGVSVAGDPGAGPERPR
jgi:hypothetical protein